MSLLLPPPEEPLRPCITAKRALFAPARARGVYLRAARHVLVRQSGQPERTLVHAKCSTADPGRRCCGLRGHRFGPTDVLIIRGAALVLFQTSAAGGVARFFQIGRCRAATLSPSARRLRKSPGTIVTLPRTMKTRCSAGGCARRRSDRRARETPARHAPKATPSSTPLLLGARDTAGLLASRSATSA